MDTEKEPGAILSCRAEPITVLSLQRPSSRPGQNPSRVEQLDSLTNQHRRHALPMVCSTYGTRALLELIIHSHFLTAFGLPSTNNVST
jgi:hypothetical protein